MLKGAEQRQIRISIAPNPSHLEAVDPVVMGLVHALQTRLGPDRGQRQVAGLLIHGDAAFAGLGMVPECLQLSNTRGAGLRVRLLGWYMHCCTSCLHNFEAAGISFPL